MFKITPNPPDIDPTSPYASIDSRKLHQAADRALDHYLCPPGSTPPPRKTSGMYAVTADTKNDDLLTDASETLGSATVMLNNHAAQMEGTHRKTLQGIAQVVMVAEMAVNRVLDQLVPTE